MADNLADRMKVVKGRATTKAVAPAPRTKGSSLFAKMIHGQKAPYGTSGPLGDDGGVSVMKSYALAAGAIGRDQAKTEADLSDRLRSTYGLFYPFESKPGSVLVPTSAGYLPETTGHGVEIPGAQAIRKEVSQRLATVKDLDPDELRHKAARGDTLAQKALNTLSDITGGATVPAAQLGDLIELQRNVEVFSRAGANNVTLPPNGRMTFPKLTAGSTAYWVGEGKDVTPSQQQFGSLSLEVKKLAVRTPFTYEMLRFSDQNVEGMIRVDMVRQAGLKADLAQLEGTGGLQIKGLLLYPTASSWTQNVDSLLTYAVTGSVFQPEDVGAMTAVLPDEVEPTAWVMRRAMWAKIKNRRADGVLPGDGKGPFMFQWGRTPQEGGLSSVETLDNTKVVWSSQVSKTRGSGTQTYILAGYFPDWIVGRLGVMEVMVDPYTLMQSMQTILQTVQFIDAGPRHTASFVLADSVNES